MAHVLSPESQYHHVQFYEDATFLAERVAAFVHDALNGRGTGAVVARAGHLTAVEHELRKLGIDVESQRALGRLYLLDAHTLLDSFMTDELPDRERFQQHVGGLITSLCALAGSNRVHVYGEMVDVLWANNQREAVVRLEQLWGELLATKRFSLLCGYRLAGFDSDAPGFETICQHHDHVRPSETFAVLTPDSATALALANMEQRARSLEGEVERRQVLEQRMMELLVAISELGAAKDREHVARVTIDKGMKAVKAVSAAMWILAPDKNHLELLAASDETKTKNYQIVALDGDTPLAQVVRTGEAEFIGSLDDYASRFPVSFARVEQLLAANQRAFAILPIVADDKPVGGLVFSYDHERRFTDGDRAFKAILARQCALALARASLIEDERALRKAAERAAASEKQARSEIELLYDLIASVNRLDSVDAVFNLALATVMAGTRCDRAAILLFDDDDVMRFKASQGLSETYCRAVEGHSPWKRDEGFPTPIAVDDTETDPAWAAYRDVFRAEGIRSLAFVPLIHQRGLIGKFMLYRDAAIPFEQRDMQLCSTVAVHVAQAVERKRNELELARAYREERDAHLEAEAATLAREEILSVVSHDLRNPLGTIMMGATSLLNIAEADRGHRTRTIAERIHRQAGRMARLIEDLVDFAGIQAGKLALTRGDHPPQEIIAATSDIFGPLAQERGLNFEACVIPNLPAVQCDPDRAVQVLSNLVANALKVTPRDGTIVIGVEPKDKEVVFYVRDTGPGIDAADMPNLFERYWRGKTSSYKGAGLGLSIARGIVDAHGGRIWAESQLGTGSTFYFSLSSLSGN